MKNLLTGAILLLMLTIGSAGYTQKALTDSFPVRAFAIAAPSKENLDSFIVFMQKELAPRNINRLILRVDYHFQYKSHPELVDTPFLSLQDVKKLVATAKATNMEIIPQINLLGHQSWAGSLGKLLKVYPQFDETPWVEMPAEYKWPNKDGLYCKSYCPLHPDVHPIVFALMDELCDAFEARAFHAGMDEVFYIGEDKCPRCGGRDKAELFAYELTLIRNRLAEKGRQLWIWGDRLIDGKTTGIGMWEGSHNLTYRAIDLIPKDVVICDWHYERPDKTAVYFAMKGFSVITCSWNKPHVAVQQVKDMAEFRRTATPAMKERYLGVMETVWSGVTPFLNGYYGKPQSRPNSAAQSTPQAQQNTPWNTFRAMFQ
jgi:hypothetical protein